MEHRDNEIKKLIAENKKLTADNRKLIAYKERVKLLWKFNREHLKDVQKKLKKGEHTGLSWSRDEVKEQTTLLNIVDISMCIDTDIAACDSSSSFSFGSTDE